MTTEKKIINRIPQARSLGRVNIIKNVNCHLIKVFQFGYSLNPQLQNKTYDFSLSWSRSKIMFLMSLFKQLFYKY